MSLPYTEWPTTSPAPSPNPTWAIVGLHQGKKLTVMGVATIRDTTGYFDSHSTESVTGQVVLDVSPSGPVTFPNNYDYYQASCTGVPDGDDWIWTYSFIAVASISLYDGGRITAAVRFTGYHDTEKVAIDSPIVTLC